MDKIINITIFILLSFIFYGYGQVIRDHVKVQLNKNNHKYVLKNPKLDYIVNYVVHGIFENSKKNKRDNLKHKHEQIKNEDHVNPVVIIENTPKKKNIEFTQIEIIFLRNLFNSIL